MDEGALASRGNKYITVQVTPLLRVAVFDAANRSSRVFCVYNNIKYIIMYATHYYNGLFNINRIINK